jgi:hypothetical protein
MRRDVLDVYPSRKLNEPYGPQWLPYVGTRLWNRPFPVLLNITENASGLHDNLMFRVFSEGMAMARHSPTTEVAAFVRDTTSQVF